MKAAGLALSGERLLATSQFHQQLPISLDCTSLLDDSLEFALSFSAVARLKLFRVL